jgi:SAM-dependent methyltransferase
MEAYAPVPYGILSAMLADVPAPLHGGALIDFGCGMGRVLVVASRQFRRVIGVEYSERLAGIARQNTKRNSSCQIETMDAAQFAIPDDAAVFFFFNPFGKQTMATVLSNIGRSLCEHPRDHRFLVCNRGPFEGAAEEVGLKMTRHKWARAGEYGWASYTLAEVQVR